MPSFSFRCQKLLSYLTELTLYEGGTDTNPDIEVLLSSGRLKLNTPRATYSHEDKYYCYLNAFNKLGIHEYSLDKVLILGYGLGSVPVILERVFEKDARYTAVELDPDILALAQQYEPKEILGKVDYYAVDAFDYVQYCNEQYDLIAVDLFLDNVIPDRFRSEDFLEELKSCVAKDGLILFNWLSYTEGLRQETEKYFASTFKAVYLDARMIETGGNRMLCVRV